MKADRIKSFSADDLLALSRGFDLPIGYFFTPPPPAADAGLYAPDAGNKGLDPIVLLDAILGTPDNLDHWADELLAYSASHAPEPRSKREKPSVSPCRPRRSAPPTRRHARQSAPPPGLRRPRRRQRRPRTPRRRPPSHGRRNTNRHADKPARDGTADKTASAATGSRKKTRTTR